MAKVDKYYPKLAKWEGVDFTDDPVDRGGATKYGVTLKTWQAIGYDKNGDGVIDAKDVKLLTYDDFKIVVKALWDKCMGDKILSQSVAEAIVDFCYHSGAWGARFTQRILGVKDDGVIGEKTLKAINAAEPRKLHADIQAARLKFLNDIVARNATQKKWIKGWTNRVNSFVFEG